MKNSDKRDRHGDQGSEDGASEVELGGDALRENGEEDVEEVVVDPRRRRWTAPVVGVEGELGGEETSELASVED